MTSSMEDLTLTQRVCKEMGKRERGKERERE